MKPYKQEALFHFTYNLDTKVVEQESRLAKKYGLKKVYKNMPYGFVDEIVSEEDREAYIELYEKLDAGEPFVTCDFRVKNAEVWSRVCMYRESMDSPFVKGVVQDVTKHYTYMIEQAEERAREAERLNDLEFESKQLMRAVNDVYDMFCIVNLSQNTYRMINYEHFVNQNMPQGGVFDELISFGIDNVAEEHEELFYNHFSRKSLLKAYAEGKKSVYLEYQHLGDDGKPYWVYTHVLFVENPNNNDIMEITLTQNIDERICRETEQRKRLEEALHIAEAANNAKSDFLSRMSHDIRTPMNAIQGFLQILKTNLHDEEKVLDVIEKMESASDTLSKLLGDILELSRIESGKVDVNYSVLNLDEHLQSYKNMFEHELAKNHVEFIIESEMEKNFVWIDEIKLTQICMNMLSNAKKFTPVGGKITIGVKQRPCDTPGHGIYQFYVRDTGIGMSKEFQKKAFEQFERESSPTESGVMGSGLGMAIIKKFTDLMGGKCDLKSRLGKGTEICSTFKLQFAADAASRKERKHYEDVDFTGRRALLAEDNGFNREIAHFVLENMGFEVEDAEDGSIAVDKLLNYPEAYFDLILMDIQMPNMDGYTATKEIRRIRKKNIAKIPIIAMTANAFQEDKEKCMKVGMNGHIAKPIDADSLLEEIMKVL